MSEPTPKYRTLKTQGSSLHSSLHGIVPEQAIEIEKALLSHILLSGSSSMDGIAPMIHSPEIFYKEQHQQIWKVVHKMYHSGRNIDMLTVMEEASASSQELSDYVIDLVSDKSVIQGSQNSLSDYVGILQSKYIHRRALQATLEMHHKLSQSDSYEAYQLIEQAHTEIAEIINGKDRIRHIGESVKTSLSKLDERIENNKTGKLPGINTGFTHLNTMTAGWQAGDLIVIAGRPGMGKTAIALYFAETAAAHGCPVLFFSLEMADYRITDRMIMGVSEVNPYEYNHGKTNHIDRDLIWSKSNYLTNLPIYIDEASSVDIDYITAMTRTSIRKHDIGLVIIDYLQLVDMKQKGGQTRDQSIGNVTRKLKQLAKELQVPVILLSQLNRALEARQSKEPSLADLRESGNIEQDADIVTLLFRPAYYDIPEYNSYDTHNMLWLNTQKHRNGNPQNIAVKHNETLSKFTNY